MGHMTDRDENRDSAKGRGQHRPRVGTRKPRPQVRRGRGIKLPLFSPVPRIDFRKGWGFSGIRIMRLEY